jgi:hypothetical protein
MSWSVYATGPKATVIESITSNFDTQAANYTGEREREGKDILACKERVLALIEDLDLEPNEYSPQGYEVAISCHGSHSTSYTHKGPNDPADSSKLMSASFNCAVARKAIPLVAD